MNEKKLIASQTFICFLSTLKKKMSKCSFTSNCNYTVLSRYSGHLMYGQIALHRVDYSCALFKICIINAASSFEK